MTPAPGHQTESGGMLLSAMGPSVRSTQLSATMRITSAKLMVTMTKYAPRTRNASLPMRKPNRPLTTTAPQNAIHTGFGSTTSGLRRPTSRSKPSESSALV